MNQILAQFGLKALMKLMIAKAEDTNIKLNPLMIFVCLEKNEKVYNFNSTI